IWVESAQGDPYHLAQAGSTFWAWGVDTSDALKWKIAQGTNLGTGDTLTISADMHMGLATNIPGDAVAGTYNYPSTASLIDVRSTTAGSVLVLQGATNGHISLVDPGAAANSKWFQIINDGGVTALRSVTDANVLRFNAISIDHNSGIVTFPQGFTFGGSTMANYLESTWTPAITGATNPTVAYTSRSGKYTRIGN